MRTGNDIWKDRRRDILRDQLFGIDTVNSLCVGMQLNYTEGYLNELSSSGSLNSLLIPEAQMKDDKYKAIDPCGVFEVGYSTTILHMMVTIGYSPACIELLVNTVGRDILYVEDSRGDNIRQFAQAMKQFKLATYFETRFRL